MKKIAWRQVLAFFVFAVLACEGSFAANTEELLRTAGPIGHPGGRLVVSQRTEPKTLNPVVALDRPSREVIGRLHADLIHINRATQQTEPALAKSWTVSGDGRE